MIYEDDELILCIDHSWSTDYGLCISGWAIGKKHPLKEMSLGINDLFIPVTTWQSRPDVVAKHPDFAVENCGFSVQIPRLATHEVIFNWNTEKHQLSKTFSFAGAKPLPFQGFTQTGDLFNEFIQMVNDRQLKVLEVGSRIVAPGSQSKRSLFSKAVSYTGFDYYPDDNTDVVGDAHRLSSYFARNSFDAIFSLSVFEHLAMPWVVAREINQLLKVGGITYHMTHNAWPIHEQPWDFWRFTDEALKALFSPALGFEVLKAGYFEPLRVYLDEIRPGLEPLPTMPSFGGVAILAKKVAEVDVERFNWNVTVEELLGATSHYPKPSDQSLLSDSDVEHRPHSSGGQPTEVSRPTLQQSLQKSRATVQRQRKRIERLSDRLVEAEKEIAAMQKSKFWQLREQWVKVKGIFKN
ncbi:MAG: methyltransferase domain-containing protein [Elainella sp. Prado103]|nr:methyltransferase domain-containing protein [Elainella sp. Prado103]